MAREVATPAAAMPSPPNVRPAINSPFIPGLDVPVAGTPVDEVGAASTSVAGREAGLAAPGTAAGVMGGEGGGSADTGGAVESAGGGGEAGTRGGGGAGATAGGAVAAGSAFSRAVRCS